MDKKEKLLVGWSVADITPLGPVSLQGQMYERISQGVRDPLKATVLALDTESGMGGSIWISVDIVSIGSKIYNEVLRRVSELKLEGLNPENIIICATHIHTSTFQTFNSESYLFGTFFNYPSYRLDIMHPEQYFEFLCSRIVQAVENAWGNRKSAKYASALGHAVVGHNRMIHYNNGETHMYGYTDSPDFDCALSGSDHGVELLYFWDEADELIGVAAGVACPAQVMEGERVVTADYWGQVRKELASHFSKEIPVLTFCLSAGDQSPRDLILRGRGEPDTVEKMMIELGKRVSESIIRELPKAEANKQSTANLIHKCFNLKLPIRMASKEQYEAAIKERDLIISQYGELTERTEDIYIKNWQPIFRLFQQYGIITRYEMQQKQSTWEVVLHIIRLNDTILNTNPFELFIDYSLRIKSRVKANQIMPIQLSCGAYGYLPNEKAVKSGGYGSFIASGLIGFDGGQILQEFLIENSNKMME